MSLLMKSQLKNVANSIEEIELVCMLDVLIKKVCFFSSVSVEIAKVNALKSLNKDKTILLSRFKLAYLVRGSTYGIRRLFTSDHRVVRERKFKRAEIWDIGQIYFESFHSITRQ